MAVAAALAVVWSGCTSDECAAGAAECDGAVAATCMSVTDDELSGHLSWTREECAGKTCVVASTTSRRVAVCALAVTQDPRCPPLDAAGEVATVCDGSHLIACRAGYVVSDTVGNSACP